MIAAEKISKIFNLGKPNEVKAVNEVSLQIAANSCVLLQGASGSGKSTLLTLLSCLARPTSGEYVCLGEKVSRWSEKFLTQFRQKNIGIIFQHFNLIQGLTVFDNIAVPLLPQQYSRKSMINAVEMAAENAQITHRLQFKVDTLSGGEMQRVAIARALAANPQIIFADEPTAHLDSSIAVEMLDVFVELKAKGKTLVITSHDSLVQKHPIFDTVIMMKDGKII
jgi:putative ABC transport system ATP-binding protein